VDVASEGLRLLRDHVERFNSGVRSGDFGPMTELFTDDAELAFEGVPVGPFRGREAILAAYREQPPDDTIEILQASEGGS
jgi:steroid Delta-isomerase